MQTKIIKQWPKGLFKILLVSEPIICFPWNLQEAGLDVFLTNCVPIHVFVCFGISKKDDQLCCLFWQTVSGYMCFFALESLGRRTRYAVFFDKLCASIHLRSFPRSTVRLTIWTVLMILTNYGISARLGSVEKTENLKRLKYSLKIGVDLCNFYRIARQWHLPGW